CLFGINKMCRRFRYLGKTRYWTVSDNELVEAAGIEPATISRNSLIYMTIILDLPILGRKWGFFDAPYIPKEFRI
ncbi:hypothetical protein SDB39_03475, partial [Legionella pneumophila serogroup 1]